MTVYRLNVEILTPMNENPTHRIEIGEPVGSLEEAIAWIKRPPRELTLKTGYILAARYPTNLAWIDDNGRRRAIERVAAFGHVAATWRGKTPPKIVLVTSSGVSGYKTMPKWAQADWLASKSGEDLLKRCAKVPRQLLVVAACAVARTVLELVKKGEKRPKIAIETAEAWTRCEVPLQEVKDAADAANAAAAYAADAASRKNHLAMSADLVRSIIKLPDVCYGNLVA